MPKGYMMVEKRAREKAFKRVKEVYVFSKYWSLIMKYDGSSGNDGCNKASEPV